MSDSTIEQARAILAHERHIQELAKAEMERVYQLQGSAIPSTATPSTTTGKAPTAAKSVLEQALDAYEARTAGLDRILGTPPSPAPKATPTAPTKAGKSALERALDLHDSRKVFPC